MPNSCLESQVEKSIINKFYLDRIENDDGNGFVHRLTPTAAEPEIINTSHKKDWIDEHRLIILPQEFAVAGKELYIFPMKVQGIRYMLSIGAHVFVYEISLVAKEIDLSREEFVVTHFKSMPKDAAGWVPLPIVTRLKKNVEGPFYFGLGLERPLSLEEIENLEINNQIVKLDNPKDISVSQRLWLTPIGDIYIADREDPFLSKREGRNLRVFRAERPGCF